LYTTLKATGRHLTYGITDFTVLPETGERAPPDPSQKGWYLINLTPKGWKAELT